MNLSFRSLLKEPEIPEPAPGPDSALDCYRRALRDLRANLVVSRPEAERQLRAQLDRLLSAIGRRTTNETLEATAAKLTDILSDYREGEDSAYQEEQTQLRKTVVAIEALLRTISRQENEHCEQLGSVLDGLETSLFEGDVLAIHRNLQEQIRKLRTCLLTLSEDGQTRESEFKAQLDGLRDHAQRKPPEEGKSEGKRSVTETESALASYLESCTLFSVVLVRIEDLSQLAQHWSQACRTQLLAAVQSRLQSYVGTRDRLHPSPEGEYIVIFRSSKARAAERAERIREIINSAWRVEMPFGLAQINLRCSTGVVESVFGEEFADLMARAEVALESDRAAFTPHSFEPVEQV